MDNFKAIERFGVTPQQCADIVRLQDDGTINKRGGQSLMEHYRRRNDSIIKAILIAMSDEGLDNYDDVKKRVDELLEEE